jgi:flagellar motility protein MotE (MotC chaperone)
MSVEFSNAYQEILLDNLIAIIKQNFVFQTQLKLAEEAGKTRAELQAKYDELMNSRLNVNDTAHEEKTRIQGALNDVMKKKSGLEKELQEKKTEIAELKEYISKLEGITPQSKLKKINPEKVVDEKLVEQTASDLFTIKANDGSSF